MGGPASGGCGARPGWEILPSGLVSATHERMLAPNPQFGSQIQTLGYEIRYDVSWLFDQGEGKSLKALVTGITGQDGSYLAELLMAKGYEVHGLDKCL